MNQKSKIEEIEKEYRYIRNKSANQRNGYEETIEILLDYIESLTTSSKAESEKVCIDCLGAGMYCGH